jgi:hypothetical protein
MNKTTRRDRLPPCGTTDQNVRLRILSARTEREARKLWTVEFKSDIDVERVVETFERTVHDAFIAGDASVEISTRLAEAIAVLLKSSKPSTKPRTHWRDRITQAAAVDYAKELEASGVPRERAAAKAAQTVARTLKKFSAATIKDRMTRRKPRSGK